LQGDLEYGVGFGLHFTALRFELARFLAQRVRLASAGMFFSRVIKVALRISWHSALGGTWPPSRCFAKALQKVRNALYY
jgi:hypothetical protein